MVRLSRLPTPSITLTAWFHAYVLCGVIGVRWGKHGVYYANSNQALREVLVEYLTYACEDDEWMKGRVLEAMRYKTTTSIKAQVRDLFPSLLPRNKRARPTDVPTELKDKDINFNHDRLEQWKERVKVIKKEIAMSENVVTQEAVEAVTDSDSVNADANNRVTVNFFIPKGMDPATLTLENYRQLTTKRFRMTKNQAQVRGLNREQAFAESKALAVSQLGE